MPVSATSRKPTCMQCGGRMRATTRGTAAGFAIAFGLFIAGILVTFIPGIGCAAGPLLCLLAFAVGFKRRKVWLCDKCGGFFERA